MSADAKSQLAVALHYDRKGAPRVVAKGRGAIGAKIIELAKANDIPIEENEVLAGALKHDPEKQALGLRPDGWIAVFAELTNAERFFQKDRAQTQSP